jgi:hypothetical protein
MLRIQNFLSKIRSTIHPPLNLIKMKKPLFVTMSLCLALLSVSCKKDDVEVPEEENEVEEFTYVEFIFTNVNNPSDVSKGVWEDADGFGPQEPLILQHPVLNANTTYKLTFVFENRLLDPVYDLMPEILDEADEHQVFFEFDEDLFLSPTGTGNITNPNGEVNYNDYDENGLPVGLETLWITAAPVQDASFRAVLGHQPGVKSATSTWDSGDIDWDIRFSINVQ